MRQGDTATVIGDIRKVHHKTRKVYCQAGDVVKIVFVDKDSAIVERPNKERYSINIKNLKHDKR